MGTRPASCKSGKEVSTPAGCPAQSVARAPREPVADPTTGLGAGDCHILGIPLPHARPSQSPSLGMDPADSGLLTLWRKFNFAL